MVSLHYFVDRVDVPEGLDSSTGRHHDLLSAGMLRDEVGDVVDTVLVGHPDPLGLGVVLRNILHRELRETLLAVEQDWLLHIS